MKNRRILGIDLGTNSLGWSVLEQIKNGQYKIVETAGKKLAGVRVFTEVGDTSGQTKAAERREIRLSRRNKYRKKLRKYETLKVLVENNMCPMLELEQWKGAKNEFKEYPANPDFLYWLRTGKRKEIPNKENAYRNPYFLRDLVSREQIDFNNQTERFQLGRALYHMAQRRGFKSNRLDQTDDQLVMDLKNELAEILLEEKENKNIVNTKETEREIIEFFLDRNYEISKNKSDDPTENELIKLRKRLNNILSNKKKKYKKFDEIFDAVIKELRREKNIGKVKKSIHDLSEKMEKGSFETLGQYFWHLYQQDRKKPENKIRGNYTSREEHYLYEFDVIMKKQYPGYVDTTISLKLPKERFKGIALDLYKGIFFQRPLKSQKGRVGKCVFEPRKRRMPKSHYLFEEFRMWSFINHIKIKEKGTNEKRFLNEAEKEQIIPLFYRAKEKFKFKEIAEKLLGKDVVFKHFKDYDLQKDDIAFNYKSDYKVTGNPASGRIKKYLKEKWNKFYNEKKKITYNELAWHALFTFEDEDKLVEFALQKLNMNEKDARYFSKIKLQQGYANLSLKAVRNTLVFLRKGMIYSHAVFLAKLPEILKKSWEENKEEIINGIGQIIENRRLNLKIANAVNALIEHNREAKPSDRIQISDRAEDSIKKTLTDYLANEFGKLTWKNMTNKNAIIETAYEILKKQLLEKAHIGGKFYQIDPLEKEIKDFLMGRNENGVIYCDSIDCKNKLSNMYHPSKLDRFRTEYAKDINGNKIKILPVIHTGAINNPTLTRALNQLRKLVNYLLINNFINNKTRVQIEMAREINSVMQKEAIKAYQEYKENKRLNARNEIAKHFEEKCKEKNCKEAQVTEELILRYLLWEEQNKIDIYEGKSTLNLCDVICPGSKYDIDHIIPRKRSWDNSMMNKTLTLKSINQQEKIDKIPYEMTDRWDVIKRNAENIYKKEYLKLKKKIDKIHISPELSPKRKLKLYKEKYKLQQDYEYLKGKFERFTMKEVPESFKNRQLVDIGLITTYAYEYLATIFKNDNDNPNIMTINGKSVGTFRSIWGLPDKDRNSHLHHMTDAIIAASITKKQYEKLAQIWGEEDEKEDAKNRIKSELEKTKPWKTFTQDVLKLEKQTLVVHFRADNFNKQTKKKLRKRGKIVKKLVREVPEKYRNYEGEDKPKKIVKKGEVFYRIPEPVYLQGDTARKALHKANYIGAIKKGDKIIYVKRVKVDKLTTSQAKNIVDERIREIVTKYLKSDKRKELINKIKKKNKELSSNEETDKALIKTEIFELEKELEKLCSLPVKDGSYMPIKKVRVEVNKPLVIKPQQEAFKSQKDYKQELYALKGENYGMVIYEKDNNRDVEFIDVFEYYKHLKTGDALVQQEIVDNKGNLLSLKIINNKPVILRKGMSVLLTKDDEEAQYDNPDWLYSRLYYIIGIDTDAIKMMHHTFGGGMTKALKHMNEIVNINKAQEVINKLKEYDPNNVYKLDFKKIKENTKAYFDELNNRILNFEPEFKKIKLSNITAGKGGNDIFDNYQDFPFIKRAVNVFDAQLENYNFKLNDKGEITEI